MIPPQDYGFLKQAGVAGVFGPGTVIPVCAQKILDALMGTLVRRSEWDRRRFVSVMFGLSRHDRPPKTDGLSYRSQAMPAS